MAKKVLFVADSLDNAHRFQQVLSQMDVEVSAASSVNFKYVLTDMAECDLIIFELRSDCGSRISAIESVMVDMGVQALLLIAPKSQLGTLRLPIQISSDFVVPDASPEECAARISMLLWPGNEISASDFISIDNMTINLATYQVKVNGDPLDLTYLEYALLVFLVTHPGRTYSRDILLRRVWGFDYYGGSRTVDVHVRRVRAKLGPELSQRLETVRGVGYLWNS